MRGHSVEDAAAFPRRLPANNSSATCCPSRRPLLDLVEVAPVGVDQIVSLFVGPVAHYTAAASAALFPLFVPAREGGEISSLTGGGGIVAVQPHLIVDMPWGGVANQGQRVAFDLRFEDGQVGKFVCSISTLPLLMGNFMQYAKMAEAVKVKSPGRTIVKAAPYKLGILIGHSLDGTIVSVDYNTTQGFPLSVAMTLEQAKHGEFSLRSNLHIQIERTKCG